MYKRQDLEHDDAESFIVVGILAPSGSVLDQLILTTNQSFWLVHDHNSSGEEEQDNHEGHDHGDHLHADHEHDHAREKPLPLIQESNDEQITSLLLRFKGRNFQALNMQRSINENTDMQAATPAIEINRLFAMMSSAEDALRILAILIMIVSAISVFISLYTSLNERKYELALMRSMGAGKGQIFGLIILEGLILALLGAFIGILLSHTLVHVFADHLREEYRYDFSGFRFLNAELWLFFFALIIGFIAALLPAIQASRTDIANTLTNG